MTLDIDRLQEWCGATRESRDVIAPGPVAALSAALDYDETLARDGQALPPCWHWLFFHEQVPASGIGEDGHPRRGDFLPPVPLPRRMWAGGHLQFHEPVVVGGELRRVSTVADITAKQGRGGKLVFVTVNHEYFSGDKLCIGERQDIVYRDVAPAPPAAMESSANTAPVFEVEREVVPDPVLLFRYSALTFNSHRIHYDRDYATGVEGYPGLVVHGPLTATLLLDLLRRDMPRAAVSAFEFRARRPLFAGVSLTLGYLGDNTGVELQARGADGALAMSAHARLDGTGA